MKIRTAWIALAVALASAPSATAADTRSVKITVKNETGYYLVAVYRAVDSWGEWGESVLGEDVAIRPYREREIDIEPGYASVRAVFDVDGTEVEVVEEADFESGAEYVWTITEEMIWESYGSDDSGWDEDWYGYGYYEDTYGYWDDTYGYYEDTYGYYEGGY